MCHQNKPKAFHAAAIFRSSISFFSDNETTSGSDCEEEENANEGPREADVHGPLEESENQDAWIDYNYPVEDEEDEEEEVTVEENDEGNDG